MGSAARLSACGGFGWLSGLLLRLSAWIWAWISAWISVGFRLDFGFWLDLAWILVRLGLDFGLILIGFDFGLILI